MKDKLVGQTTAVLTGGFLAVQSERETRTFILAISLLLIIGIMFIWKPLDFFGKASKPEAVLLACGLLTGFLYGMTVENSLASPLVIERIEIQGRLSDWRIDDKIGQGTFILEDVYPGTKEHLEKKYHFRVYPEEDGVYMKGWDRVKPGDTISVTARLEHPKPPGTEGEFDLPLYYAVRGLGGTITAFGEAKVLEEGVPGFT
ncbi:MULTISPECIES: DUF4131 domain-containing protein [unclassified Dehalobacter]|uniref:DUF4131 domain-containing protein n=1 Tax=unclassified Dehalobacter TaxID=2635733 RepID=UPI000E6C6020|nr:MULTISPECIES: DUF4131 domain-containing protein [unclassified Dehalobacter]RJE47099.1 hypothetical protein A7K50_03720 [Dehalobacter sp. MCB1]TCX53739.1 DUF4131 domain-containing protein [Dehalobacter sp. 14DCB1]TCX55042.1 DUF4131 domain-containing protein [Dehalobacter sp. 12DCB1]